MPQPPDPKPKNRPRTGGWVKITNPQYVAAIRESKVADVDGLHHIQFVYVPRWVKGAIQAYEKFPGYAGLTLAEFLQKSQPEEELESTPS
jgi:hypothetical protein